MQRLLALGVCGMAALGCATTVDSEEQEVQLPSLQIVTGTVFVGGCSPSPSQIIIKAGQADGAPLQQLQQQPQQSASPPVKRALVLPTNNPHSYSFMFIGLDARSMYRLSAELSPNAACPKTAWRGPAGGWLDTRPNHPIRIEGVALRTQTEILGVRPVDPNNPNNVAQWGAGEPINLANPQGSIRTLRWRTDVPGATQGLLQVSADPFTGHLGTQSAPPRILATQFVPINQQGWSEVAALDFGQLVAPACDLQQNPNGCVCDPQSPNGCGQTRTVRGALQKELLHGAPIYVRVVPADQFGNLLDNLAQNGLPSHATLVSIDRRLPDLVPPPPVAPLQMQIEYQPAQNQYALSSGHPNTTCFRVSQPYEVRPGVCNPFALFEYDRLGCIMSKDFPIGTTIAVGTGYCIWHESGGWLSDVFDAFTGFFDAFGELCNDIAKLYEDIKVAVVNAVASAIDELGIVSCDTVCRAGLTTALNIGLAALGLPPSLPNFDELKAEGIDYLEDLAAEESGVPKEVIDEVREVAAEAIETMKPHPVGLPAWVVPDDGFRPPRITLTIAKNPAFFGPLLPNAFAFDSYDSYSAPELILPPNALAAGKTYRVPMQLLPDMSGLTRLQVCPWGPSSCHDVPPLTQEYLENDWYNLKYASQPCFRMRAMGKAYGFNAGTPWLLGEFGQMIQWTVPTLAPFASSLPVMATCSG